jgi:hypothetical protein
MLCAEKNYLILSCSFILCTINQKIMEQTTNSTSRKKFLFQSAAALSFLGVLKFFSGNKKKKNKTAKLLTQDGKLVEVDISVLSSQKKKITNTELQNWIKK